MGSGTDRGTVFLQIYSSSYEVEVNYFCVNIICLFWIVYMFMNYDKCEPNLVKFMGIFPKSVIPWQLCEMMLVFVGVFGIGAYRMGVLKSECCD